MNDPKTKSKNVEQTTELSYEIKLEEFGGKVVGKWGTSDIEPDNAHMVLFLGKDQKAVHKLGKKEGEHTFDFVYGKGYRIAIVARNFDNNEVEIVSTEVTEDSPKPLSATRKYTFRIALGRNSDDNAQLTWDSNAAFRPRQSQAFLYVKGNQEKDYWIEKANHSFDTDVRWGVALAAAYTAEDYNGKRIDLVRTPTTKTESVATA